MNLDERQPIVVKASDIFSERCFAKIIGQIRMDQQSVEQEAKAVGVHIGYAQSGKEQMMSNYIDSDRINLKNYLMHKDGKPLYSDDFFVGIKWVIDRIDEMPSIDIVYCGECKYWIDDRKSEDDMGTCGLTHYFTNADDFCSYGSRSEKPNNSERSSE